MPSAAPSTADPRFAVTRNGFRSDIVFDDGGMNLLSSAALVALRDVILKRMHDDTRVLAFRSGRPGLFAAGADMAEMRAFTPRQAAAFSRLGQTLFAAIERLPILTVAVIDGDCFGGALDLAMAFDVRLATTRARFAHPGARLGIVTGFGGTTRWRTLLDPAAAHTLFIENRVLDARAAEQIGLARVVSNAEEEIARLGNADPRAVRLVKELAAHAAALTPAQLQLLESKLGTLYFR
jgi:enoyl-CoA hydratase